MYLMLMTAIVIAGTFGGLTDWLFMGILSRRTYDRFPEVWRVGVREAGNRNAIILSTLLGYAMTGAVVGICAVGNAASIKDGIIFALLAWTAGPLVITVINGIFVRLHPWIIVTHSLGYLARFLIAGIAAGFVLRVA